MSYPEFLIDKRVIERNIHKGIVDAGEYDKLLGRLPDVQHNAESSSADLDADLGDDDEIEED